MYMKKAYKKACFSIKFYCIYTKELIPYKTMELTLSDFQYNSPVMFCNHSPFCLMWFFNYHQNWMHVRIKILFEESL